MPCCGSSAKRLNLPEPSRIVHTCVVWIDIYLRTSATGKLSGGDWGICFGASDIYFTITSTSNSVVSEAGAALWSGGKLKLFSLYDD
jgi:hypothetical protein